MISLDSIVHNVKKCKAKPLRLPSQDLTFTQKTAFQLRKEQLQNMSNIIHRDFEHQVDYSMQKEFENLQENTVKDNKSDTTQTINNQSLVMINENSTCNLPEILLNVFKTYNKEQVIIGNSSLNLDDYYLYGLKNPESFCKAILMVYDSSFIIQKNHMRKNYVLTFKKEMAIKLDNYYKTLKYRNYKINKSELVQNIMNQDNYTDYDFYLYVADYCKINLVILDIINYKYNLIKYHQNDLLPINELSNEDEQYIIVKYTNNIYLPLMNSNGGHSFSQDIMDIIRSQFENETHKFRERTFDDIKNINNQDIDDNVNVVDNDICCDENSINQIGGEGAEIKEEEVSNTQIIPTLKPITKYVVAELKNMAQNLNINLKHESNNKNKTKKELYDEIKEKNK